MDFNNFEYKRPEMAAFTKNFETALLSFKEATDYAAQSEALATINTLRQEFISMGNICHVRHTVNTEDKFYEDENNFFDTHSPQYEALNTRFYKLLLTSQFRDDLEKKWGSQIFIVAELRLKTFEPSILKDLEKENKLASDYVKIKAVANIEVNGKTYNLSNILPIENGKDRSLRKTAYQAKWNFYQTHSSKVEQIYDEQVKVRHQIAQKLGYNNFVELGYARMVRSDYNAEMVAVFREQVRKHIVPLASALYERQRKRLNLEKLTCYDEGFRFASGNPKPKGDPDWIVNKAAQMYRELSPETNDFFGFMINNNLMDLVNRKGKATGGYCIYINEHKSPYIFSNFCGTSGDIDVLTHEAGHAFQVYSSRDVALKEYIWPTMEACEIHSMSMEFFTWPWMNLFFEEETDKYKFGHLAGAIKFLPYGVAVDEFQHYVYENPNASIEERNQAWRKIEQKYLPHRDYDSNEFLEGGGFWQKQSHIFTTPFYYIDYTLAQFCAFQFWMRDRQDHDSAWSDYLNLCKAGGSHSFLDLVKLAGLRSPFEDNCIEEVVKEIKNWLDNVDDTLF